MLSLKLHSSQMPPPFPSPAIIPSGFGKMLSFVNILNLAT